jgi:threonine/homoserine/homoserine lactone efflux protein
MDATTALIAGLAAGIAIAAQVGAVSLLLVDTALAAGPRAAVAAGMGVATADFGFAVVAVLTGGVAGAVLAGHQSEIRWVAAATLAAIAASGLVALLRPRTGHAHDGGAARRGTSGRASSVRANYLRFLAITAINPLTVASFAAVAASLSLAGFATSAAFVAGVGLASGAWHLFLTLAAAHAGRWITPRVQRALGIAGRVAVLAIAARLALGA